VPVHYHSRSLKRRDLVAFYRMALSAFITSLKDGMNLVAKEFVAAQNPDDPGVLILSRFAGAARQMKEALLVNPNSPEEIADAIRRAYYEPVMHLLEEGGRDGSLRVVDDPASTSVAIFGAVTISGLSYLVAGAGLSTEQTASQLLGLLLDGLRPRQRKA
jgi:hypothetical protein